MSIRVEVEALRAESGRHGSVAYLCTVSDGSTPHVVSVALRWGSAVDGPTCRPVG